MGAHRERRPTGGAYSLILSAGFLLLLGAMGGASRADELQQTFIRAGAILVIAAALWPLDFATFRDARGPLIATGLILSLLLLQLVPMPFAWWQQMPGHRIYANVAGQTDSINWRPWSLSPDLTINAIGGLLPAIAAGLAALMLDFRARLVIARFVVCIACASALLGLMQFAAGGTALHLFRTSSENSAVGLFANRNHQAVLMACAIPIIAALASVRLHRQHATRRDLMIAASIALLLLMGLAATGSRMGILLGLIGLAAAVIILWTAAEADSTGRKDSGKWWMGVAAATVAAAVPLIMLIGRSGSIARLTSDPVDQTRAAALAPMWQAARAFFPFGAGFGTFDPVFRHFEPDSMLSTIYLNEAHNEPMQIAIEGGLPALLLLLLFLLWWIVAARRTMRRKDSPSRRALGTAMTATTFILMLSSLVDYPLRTPLLSSLFAIACVELLRSKQHRKASTES